MKCSSQVKAGFQMNSLLQVFMAGKKNNWCDKIFCTTCGASDYRRAIGSLGFELAGMNVDQSWRPRSPLPRRVRESLCKELCVLTSEDVSRHEHAIGLTLSMLDLAPPIIFSDSSLRNIISGSAVDAFLERWNKEHIERYRTETKEEIEERRRKKAESRLKEHIKKVELAKKRGEIIKSANIKLKGMEAQDRLRALAEDDTIILPAVPQDLIEELYGVIPDAEVSVLRQLSPKIHGKKKPWKKLSKLIDERL